MNRPRAAHARCRTQIRVRGLSDLSTRETRNNPIDTPDEVLGFADRVILWVVVPFNGVKVFSATMFADRGQLGDKVTAWLASGPHRTLSDIVVTQSSDAAFHCVTISVFYHEPLR
ncbi:MAG TPA: hypothetical protein VFK02_32590 [Kofleriaceae bacterium]|nr:hypothetical protein [Kofleriaceae bacterium]